MKEKPLLSPKAVALLRRVKEHILEEPRRFDMETWRENGLSGRLGHPYATKTAPACGTIACIGGWVEALGQGPRGGQSAYQLLGVKVSCRDSPLRRLLYMLFHEFRGPHFGPWRGEDARAGTLRTRARTAARVIERVIAEHGDAGSYDPDFDLPDIPI